MSRAYEIRRQWVHDGCIGFSTDGKISLRFVSSLHLLVQWDRALKTRSYWPMNTKRVLKGQSGLLKFRSWRHSLLSSPKLSKNLWKQNEKERTWIECKKDVEQMDIRCLADEKGYRRMTTPKGLLGTISKQMHSEKSGCWTNKAYVSRTPNVHTWDTYDNYEMHTLTFFYVRATNDL